jgi:hypothetical protein
MGGPDDDEDDGDGDGALPLRLVEAPDPNDGTGNYQYRPCQLMTTQQVARKLHMPVERLHRKDWRDALGAFQYGGPDMGKGCKVYWPREKVNAFLDAQKVDA